MHRRLSLLLLVAIMAPAAFAQISHSLPSVNFRPGLSPLVQGWRTQAGDNLAWAQPDYDDSAWQPATLSADTPLPAGQRWYRMRLHLKADDPDLALLLIAPSDSFEVWIDGQRVPGFLTGSWLRMSSKREFVIPLPPHGEEIEVALRVFFPRYLADSYGGKFNVFLGGVAAAETAARAAHDERVLDFVPSALFNLAIAVAGIGALLLFFAQRSRSEYLWLGPYFIVLGASTALWHAVDAGLLPYWTNILIGDPIFYLVLACQVQFSFAFINRKVSLGWIACEAAVFVAMLLAYLTAAGLVPSSVYWLIEAAISFAIGFGLPILLLIQFRRGNREAGLLILPSLLPAAAVALNDLGTAGTALGFNGLASFNDYFFTLGRVHILVVDLADIGFLLAIGALLLFRFTRVSRQQARASAEFEAAQRVQSLLLRRAPSRNSTAHIEVVYRPAQEVGGDFFHTANINGATRIVIGDVSGKGMGAAMLVSVLLGALDGIRDPNPAAVLHHLNHIMFSRQQGGFATCSCALLASDGSLTLANAGHLSPYRNGEEVPLESGLPLGIAPDIEYPETTLRLSPGDTLTFMSDGVVEAQSATRELFGFDRTRQISTQSAEAIAAAAQAHVQEDDITVLTVQFQGKPRPETFSVGLKLEQLKAEG